VIGVMVGNQDGVQAQRMFVESGAYRGGIARIDHQRPVTCGGEPKIVVAKCGDRIYLHPPDSGGWASR